ncbi:MAG TPA: TolC family protein [Urbifossiella sp.]|nr:TolC family protein [Urbifossiella sp.]
MRRGATSYACWVLVAAAAGCHHTPTCPTPTTTAVELPVVARQPVEADTSALAGVTTPARPATVRRLTAAECRALAVKNAPLADDLDNHPGNDGPSHPRLRPKKDEKAACARAVRGYAADELRNRAAGDALDDFYKLARAEAQFDLLVAARAEVAARIAEADAAAKHGLRDRGDPLRAQLHEFDAQLGQLHGGIGALNASLRGRLALDPADATPLGPADPLRVRGEDVDPAAAVRTALHYRPDLNFLRALTACRDGSDSGLSGQALTSINPLLAAATGHPFAALLMALCGKDDGSADRLASALAGRERQAEAEVRAAAATLHGHRAAAAARAAGVKDAAARVVELEKQAAAGLSVQTELTAARLDLLKARGAVLEAAADWHRAEARLRQAMGTLVRE